MAYSQLDLESSDTIYMIVTDRFLDADPSNNGTPGLEHRPGHLRYYQGGDWKGIKSALPYIRQLGFTAIWLSPPQDNVLFSRSGDEAGYHGYYTRDFGSVNPHFGTPDDLSSLISSAEKLGIKVILDAQLNHTADFLDYPQTGYHGESRPAAPFDDPSWYHDRPDIENFDDPFEAQNYSLGGLDDLAQENPECWEALKKAYRDKETGTGWLNYGFAGARLDAVVEIPKSYLSLFQSHAGKRCFGEAYTGSPKQNSDFQNYIWSVLDFPLYFQINNVFCGKADWSGIKWVFDQDYLYANARRLITFIDNHDRARFLANAADNYATLRMALAFLYGVRGIPVLYYGTEQNMAGDHKYSEEMQNEYNREMMVGFDETGPTCQWIKRLNEIRKLHRATLVDGEQRELWYAPGDPVYVFARLAQDGDLAICAFNNSATAQERRVELPPAFTDCVLTDLLDTRIQVPLLEGNTAGAYMKLELPPNSAFILSRADGKKWTPPECIQTRIIVHYDTGYGNALTIRGDTPPLSWDYGQRCENVSENVWQYIMERPSTGEIEFKILFNDKTWETGPNHCVTAGQETHIQLSFGLG